MTIESIIADTKQLIPLIEDRKIRCELENGDIIDVKIADHLDFTETFSRMRKKVYSPIVPVEKKPKQMKWDHKKLAQLEKLLKEGKTNQQIGDVFGISSGAVNETKRKNFPNYVNRYKKKVR